MALRFRLPLLLVGLSCFVALRSSDANSRYHAPTGISDERTLEERIDEFNSAFSEHNQLSGVLLVAVKGEVVLHKAYGMANYELGVPNQLDTSFNVASVTKAFTKAALIQALIEQKLQLGDPISKWLPDFPHGDKITVEHLLRFRAGLPHRVTSPAEESTPRSAQSVTKLAGEYVAEHGLLCEPGAESNYSSATYAILARILALVDQQPFANILDERIFSPAGMTRTQDLVSNDTLIFDRASSYVPGKDTLLNAPLKDLSFLVGGGSVQSTAKDLYQFVQYLHGDSLSLRSIRASLADEDGLHLTGATNGYFCFVDEFEDKEITIVYTGNSWGGCAGQLRGQLVSMIEGDHVEPPVFPALLQEDDPNTPAEYCGEYESRPGATTHVEIRNGQLFVGGSVVLPIGSDRYFHQGWHVPIEFIRHEGQAEAAQEVVSLRIEFAEPQIQPKKESAAR